MYFFYINIFVASSTSSTSASQTTKISSYLLYSVSTDTSFVSLLALVRSLSLSSFVQVFRFSSERTRPRVHIHQFTKYKLFSMFGVGNVFRIHNPIQWKDSVQFADEKTFLLFEWRARRGYVLNRYYRINMEQNGIESNHKRWPNDANLFERKFVWFAVKPSMWLCNMHGLVSIRILLKLLAQQ